MSELEAAIKHAIGWIDGEISQKQYRRAVCEIDGQKIYVANLTAQIKQLEGYKAALAARRPATTDLTSRLRAYAAKYGEIDPERAMCLEAAEALERTARLPDREGEIRKAAERVVWFDWSDNDMDAVAAIDRLRNALRNHEQPSGVMRSAKRAADTVAGWSESKQDYASRVVGDYEQVSQGSDK